MVLFAGLPICPHDYWKTTSNCDMVTLFTAFDFSLRTYEVTIHGLMTRNVSNVADR